MNDYGLGRWGKYLEAELMGLQIVRVHVLTSGPIEDPTSWVQGRIADPTLYLTAEAVHTTIEGSWAPDWVFFWREVPSVRFITDHGSVVVTDLWGDTQYRTLRGVKARAALTFDAPLIRAAERVELLSAMSKTSPVIVTPIGPDCVEPLLPRGSLQAWSSYAAPDHEGGYTCLWAKEANDYNRAGARSVMREFLAANSTT
jgi:hypothetical protein